MEDFLLGLEDGLQVDDYLTLVRHLQHRLTHLQLFCLLHQRPSSGLLIRNLKQLSSFTLQYQAWPLPLEAPSSFSAQA